jgi:hypothetical protein
MNTDPSVTAARAVVSPTVVADLGLQLAALSRRLDQLTVRHNDLAEATYQLVDQTAAARDGLPDHPIAPAPPAPCWADMTAEQAAAEWDTLADWIAHTLVPWYEITRDQLPDCWPRHRPAVMELSWLHHTHRAAHQRDALPHLAAQWHTEWKPTVLHALGEVIPRHGARTCGPGHHLATYDEQVQTARPYPPTPPPGTHPQQPPAEQLAHRHHWHTHFQQARTHDLNQRQGQQTDSKVPNTTKAATMDWPSDGCPSNAHRLARSSGASVLRLKFDE